MKPLDRVNPPVIGKNMGQTLQTPTLGIGIDLIPVILFRQLSKRGQQKSWTTFFTQTERDYSFKKTHPDMHLAARFAAKEAAIKAFAQLGISLTYDLIEIRQSARHEPLIYVRQPRKSFITGVSLTHTREMAAAVVWVIRKA